jgi:hypothetical protein
VERLEHRVFPTDHALSDHRVALARTVVDFLDRRLGTPASRPPAGLPRYRVLTGPDDETFCRRVSGALDLGYRLHGGPAVTFNGERVIVAQALVWSGGVGSEPVP